MDSHIFWPLNQELNHETAEVGGLVLFRKPMYYLKSRTQFYGHIFYLIVECSWFNLFFFLIKQLELRKWVISTRRAEPGSSREQIVRAVWQRENGLLASVTERSVGIEVTIISALLEKDHSINIHKSYTNLSLGMVYSIHYTVSYALMENICMRSYGLCAPPERIWHTQSIKDRSEFFKNNHWPMSADPQGVFKRPSQEETDTKSHYSSGY